MIPLSETKNVGSGVRWPPFPARPAEFTLRPRLVKARKTPALTRLRVKRIPPVMASRERCGTMSV